MKLTLIECREAKKDLDDLISACVLNSSGKDKIAPAMGILQTIIMYLEKGVALDFPEKKDE